MGGDATGRLACTISSSDESSSPSLSQMKSRGFTLLRLMGRVEFTVERPGLPD